jgi:hypothetical protein
MSEHERSEGHRPSPFDFPRDISAIADWKKKKMVKEPNGEDENVDQMDFNELIVKLLQLTAVEGISERKIRKIVKLAIEVVKEKN